MAGSPRRRRARASVPLAILGLAAGCGGSEGPTTLTVLASPSMTEVFGEMGVAYRQEHPDVRFRFEFGGSLEMADRLADHDPGDVLVTADAASMKASARYLAGPSRVVAHDSLSIALAPGNPRRVRGLRDLARPGLRVAVGAAIVPAGRYARQAFARAGVTVRPGSEEISSRAVLDRVRAGEADAGVVFVTDLRSAGAAASSVPIPADENVTVSFPAAPVRGDHQDEASAFVSWLLTPAAQKLFGKYGFAGAAGVR
ncbi:molybdate ABC transporter substrate-binding protein [Actinomadura fibrosa]|uniref:Molybdate ABC transporter substrate-binding protein n=1 Tax=Actinomadura fibrosa TaxID=111802 RepID=A0ABW2XMD9_9ACTN|nr:molybdate ABC transporter substrate-binding protein [Actinomadura fibrosa]